MPNALRRWTRLGALWSLAAGFASAAGGCVDALDDGAGGLGPVFGLSGALLARDDVGHRLWTIDWHDGAPRQRAQPFAAAVSAQVDDAAGGLRLVLDRPAETVHVLRGDGSAPLATELGAPFGDVALCDDGTAAIAFHREGLATAALANSAEVALLALDGAAAPRRATVSGLAKVPMQARCAAILQAADGPHRLVWLTARSAIGLLDFGPTEAHSVVVPLTSDPDAAQIVPTRTVALPTTAGLDLYVIAAGSNDVMRLSISLGAAAPAVSLDQIGAGVAPGDLEVFDSPDGRRAATLDLGSRTLTVVNPATGTGISVPLEDAMTRWTPYQGADGGHAALAWGEGVAALAVVDLDRLEKKKGKAVKRLRLEHAASAITIVSGFAVVRHNQLGVLSVADLASGKVTYFQGTGVVDQVLAVGGAVYLRARSTQQAGATLLSRIELPALQGSSVSWRRTAEALLPLGGTGVALAAPGLGGRAFALFPTGTGGEAVVLQGVGMAGALQGKSDAEEVP